MKAKQKHVSTKIIEKQIQRTFLRTFLLAKSSIIASVSSERKKLISPFDAANQKPSLVKANDLSILTREDNFWTKHSIRHHYCKNHQSFSHYGFTYQQKKNWKITHCWVQPKSRLEVNLMQKKSLFYCQTRRRSLDMLLNFVNANHLMHFVNSYFIIPMKLFCLSVNC